MITLPQRFKERMKELLGEEYSAFEASYEQEKVQGLRFNSLKTKEGREPDWEEAGVKTLAAETAVPVPFPAHSWLQMLHIHFQAVPSCAL